MVNKTYDVFVIGSGIAGQTTAQVASKHNLNVAICDFREFGGVCANRGCDPKKVILQFAELVAFSNNLKNKGLVKTPKVKWKDIQKLKNSFVSEIPERTEEKLIKLGIDIYHQEPKFLSKNKILIEGKTISAKKFVIATGLTPSTLKFKGAEYLKLSDDFLKLKKRPKSAIFIGAGYIGLEFACLLNTLGSKVTIINKSDSILPQFDPFLVEKLVEKLESQGVKFVTNATVTTIEKLTKNLRLNYTKNNKSQSIKARAVFNTAGRVPSISNLNLKEADIEFSSDGIHVNEYMQSTSNPNVFACGDVTNASLPLTPLSGLQGFIAGHNIVKSKSKKFSYPLVPSTVFTLPNLSSVGLLENEAKKRYKNVLVLKGDATEWFNAKKGNASVYAYKIIINERTDEILGAHILGEKANECINVLSLAITRKITRTEFKKLIFTYPSWTNDLKKMLSK